jgi:hypothetical protein
VGLGRRVHLSMARASAMKASNRRELAAPALSGAGLSGSCLVGLALPRRGLERLPLVSISIFFVGRLRRDVGRPRDTGNRIKRPHGGALLALGL